MRHLPRCLVCLASALLLFAAPTTTLTVTVHTKQNKPVENATVIVRFVHGHSVKKLGRGTVTQWSARTNKEGVVTMPPLPQGKVLVQVIAEDYQTFGQAFDVDQEKKAVDVELSRPQKQYSAH